jgi:hypothetical protein
MPSKYTNKFSAGLYEGQTVCSGSKGSNEIPVKFRSIVLLLL